MKIGTIHIRHFQGLRAADLTLVKPLALIAGANGAGKSSMAEAIIMALTGEPSRVSLKKDWPQLLTDGESKGVIEITGPVQSHAWSMRLPSGQHIAPDAGCVPGHAFLPFVLDAGKFAGIEPNERRRMLYALTGSGCNPIDVGKRLAERGATAERVDAILPILRNGFDTANATAKSRATEARGAWKAITGEAYGSSKAETWKAPVPDNLPTTEQMAALSAEIVKLTTQIGQENQRLGAAQQIAKQAEAARARIDNLRQHVEKIPRLETKLAVDEKSLAEWETKVTETQALADGMPKPKLYSFPCCGVSVFMAASGKLMELEGGNDEPDADAKRDLPPYIESRDLLRSSVGNDQRDLAAAKSAVETLKAAEAEGLVPPESDPLAIKQRLSEISEKLTKAEALSTEYKRNRNAAAEAARFTKEAADYHASVLNWTLIADALAPDGIPAEILAGALRPVNDKLQHLSEVAQWARVSIDNSMCIRADGRLYGLLSESEQYRCDVLLALVIAEMSGLCFVLLDRFDVLDLTGRGDLVALLEDLSERKVIDTAIVCGTLKALPSLSAHWSTHWIDSGRVGDWAAKAAA